jgi:uncharacterized protein YcfJ
MKKLLASLAAISLAIPVSMTIPAGSAMARTHHRHYSSTARHRNCRYSSGTTGLIAGGVGGAVIGDAVIGHGVVGPIVGAVGGAFGGRAIDRSMTARRRCR